MVLTAWGGHHQVARILAENGAELDVAEGGQSNMNPLHYAARYNHLATIDVLIELGAALDAGKLSLRS